MSICIYCDESCHLENDESNVMGLGAVWTSRNYRRSISFELREIKQRHNAKGELKWTKVTSARLGFYQELVDWFFQNQNLNFRALVVPNKKALDHDKFNQGSHDNFYYKMYFSLLNKILTPEEQSEIYIDIKDTRSKFKVQKLYEVLCNNQYDFTKELISKVQQARSHELELMQLADFLLGAVMYRHRGLKGNQAKLDITSRIEHHTGRPLTKSTSPYEQKFNTFVWRARGTQ